MVRKEIINLQPLSDSICHHFAMPQIPIEFSKRMTSGWGIYYGNVIRLSWKLTQGFYSKKELMATLIHELAHHLKKVRFNHRKKGYFKKEMWNKMEYAYTESGEKWYAPTGPLEPAYFIVGTAHDKLFQKCEQDIWDFLNKIEEGA